MSARTKRRHENTLATQIGQYGMVPLWFLMICQDPRAIQLYALLMARWADRETGRCWPDREEHLVPAMGCSLSTVDRAIAVLKDVGALKTVLKHGDNGAVVGMDFIVIQVDPARAVLSVTNDNKEKADLPVTDDKKDAIHLPVTGDKKADGQNVIGDGQNVTNDSAIKEQPESDNQIQERTDLSTASPPTQAPGTSPEPPAAPNRTLLEDYHDGFVARFTTDPADPKKPAIHGGKDGKLLKDLADRVGEANVRRMLLRDGQPGWFFRTPDPFITSTGYTVGVFVSCYDKLQLTEKPARDAASAEAQVALMADMRARGEARQQELEQQARAAIVAASPDVRAHVRRDVVADLTRQYPGIDQRMPEDRWAHCVKGGMVRFVVDVARREQKTPADVVATYAEKVSAA